MSTEPTQDPSDGYVLVPGTKLRTRDMTGVATYPATGRHRVVTSCRSGHKEVHTERREWIEAMVSACRHVMPDGRACEALVNVVRYVGPDGIEIGMILILDPKTPPDNPEAAR